MIRNSIDQALKKLEVAPENCFVKLDGALRAPSNFEQETIIKGDSKELVIGLASILAKVTRDTYMCRVAKKHPEYNFEIHKGYGTKSHRAQIAKIGLSPEHRSSYCQNRHIWANIR